MTITKQINANECGICALNSLYQHYYGKDKRDDLLKESNIKSQGLSLYDFEKLAIKYGIFCETYKVDNREFKDLQTKDYFVCLLKQDTGYHYVIVKKSKSDIYVYDSMVGKYKSSYEDFVGNFSGILILVSKTSIKQSDTKHNNLYDWKFISILTSLNIVMILISIVCAKYLNIVINALYINYEIKEIIQISYVFLMFYISGDLIRLISTNLESKKYKSLFQKYSDDFINCIGNKKNDFTNKVDKNNLYLIEHAMQSICSYQCFELPNLICSIFFSSVLLFYISFIQYQYFIFCIISLLVVVVETLVKMKYTENLCKKTIDNCINNNGVINQAIDYIYMHSNNSIHLNQIKTYFKTNYHEFSSIYVKNSLFTNWSDFILSFFEKIIFIGIVVAYVLMNKANTTLNLIFICGIFGMFWGNLKNISSFYINKIQYKRMKSIYSNIVEIGNKNIGCEEIKEKINFITLFDKHKITIKNGGMYNGKINIPAILSKNITNDAELKINDTNMDKYSNEQIFMFDVFSKSSLNDELIENKIFHELIKLFSIETKENCILNTQLINVANLLSLKNNLICFNDDFKYLDSSLKEFFYKDVLPFLKKENFIIFYHKN